MPHRSNGFGSKPSVVSCTVLSPVSGSAGFKSSVFLSSCAITAPDNNRMIRAVSQRCIGPTQVADEGGGSQLSKGLTTAAIRGKQRLSYESEHKRRFVSSLMAGALAACFFCAHCQEPSELPGFIGGIDSHLPR